jgi:protein gp37
MAEFYDKAVKSEWRQIVLSVINATPRHTYHILTKKPDNPDFLDYTFPSNVRLGVSVCLQKDLWRLHHLQQAIAHYKFVSFEPLLENVGGLLLVADLKGIDLAIIGAKTGRHPFRAWSKWIESLTEVCHNAGVQVFYKKNLDYP